MLSNARPRVIVIGGGVSGLVAAHNLQRDHDVTVIEAEHQLGGKIATATFRDHPLDLGADAFITRNPAAVNLCIELGLGDHLIEPSTAGAAVYTNRRIHPLPKGLVFGIPTDLPALYRSRTVGLFGVLRMLVDLISLKPVVANDIAIAVQEGRYDPTVAEVFTSRFGRRIVARLIDPLIGGINASDVQQLSLYAAMPRIAEQLRSTRSVVRRLAVAQQTPATTASSIFRGLSGGMAQLIDALEHALLEEHTAISRSEPVQTISTSTTGFLVVTARRELEADHIILATPAHVSAKLVAQLSPVLSKELAGIPYASVATVTFAWPEDKFGPYISQQLAPLIGRRPQGASAAPSERILPGSGVLIARDEALMMSAASFTSTKWPRSAGSGEIVLRVSLGRHGDDRMMSLSDEELIAVVRKELTRTLQIDAMPLDAYVQRWPQSFPQYVRGHIARVRHIEQIARSLRIELTGAAYHGIGIPSCIDSANAVAERIRAEHQRSKKLGDDAGGRGIEV